MIVRRLLPVVACVLVAGCATGPTPDEAAAGVSYGATAVLVPRPASVRPLPLPDPVRLLPGPPTDALSFFRAVEQPCALHVNLASRGAEPAIEPDRFANATVVRQLGADRALVEDGRGTRLIVDGWPYAGRLLPESGRADEPLPDPYRLKCPEGTFTGLGQVPQLAPGN